LICLRFMGMMKSGLNIRGFPVFYIIYWDLNGLLLFQETDAWDEKAIHWKRGVRGGFPSDRRCSFQVSFSWCGIKEEGSREKKEHAGSFRGPVLLQLHVKMFAKHMMKRASDFKMLTYQNAFEPIKEEWSQ